MPEDCVECGAKVEDEDEWLCPTCLEDEVEEDKARAREYHEDA